mgnify:CR=1 FL=1
MPYSNNGGPWGGGGGDKDGGRGPWDGGDKGDRGGDKNNRPGGQPPVPDIDALVRIVSGLAGKTVPVLKEQRPALDRLAAHLLGSDGDSGDRAQLP